MTRGERNNNPMNVRQSATRWQGESDKDFDPGFEEFKTPQMGIRCGCKVLLYYQEHWKLNTIRQIIFRYAPPQDSNNTGAYIDNICQRMALGADDTLNLRNRDQLASLAIAIIAHENRQLSYPLETILEGVDLALES